MYFITHINICFFEMTKWIQNIIFIIWILENFCDIDTVWYMTMNCPVLSDTISWWGRVYCSRERASVIVNRCNYLPIRRFCRLSKGTTHMYTLLLMYWRRRRMSLLLLSLQDRTCYSPFYLSFSSFLTFFLTLCFRLNNLNMIPYCFMYFNKK